MLESKLAKIIILHIRYACNEYTRIHLMLNSILFIGYSNINIKTSKFNKISWLHR